MAGAQARRLISVEESIQIHPNAVAQQLYIYHVPPNMIACRPWYLSLADWRSQHCIPFQSIVLLWHSNYSNTLTTTSNTFKTLPTLMTDPDRFLKPAPTAKQELERRMKEAPKIDLGFTELSGFSPVDAQRFVNYLGSRWRTLGCHWYTRNYSDPEARLIFERECGIEVVRMSLSYLTSF